MRLPATGRTLPWQLDAAHDPGPVKLPEGDCLSAEAICAKADASGFCGEPISAEMMAITKIASHAARRQVMRPI